MIFNIFHVVNGHANIFVPLQNICLFLVQVIFEKANHWLYLEEPEKFNRILKDFVLHGLPAVSKYTRV